MSDNEIIKALECHGVETTCIGCPIEYPPFGCSGELARQALSLINRQQAEIERLQNEIRFLHANDMTIAEKVKEQAKGYERGIKEFAERLKEKLFIADDNFNPVVTEKEIDNLVKETVGEDK